MPPRYEGQSALAEKRLRGAVLDVFKEDDRSKLPFTCLQLIHQATATSYRSCGRPPKKRLRERHLMQLLHIYDEHLSNSLPPINVLSSYSY